MEKVDCHCHSVQLSRVYPLQTSFITNFIQFGVKEYGRRKLHFLCVFIECVLVVNHNFSIEKIVDLIVNKFSASNFQQFFWPAVHILDYKYNKKLAHL